MKATAAETAAAYILDRAEQYDANSGIYAALNAVAWDVAEGEHIASRNHGELDDLIKRIRRVVKENRGDK